MSVEIKVEKEIVRFFKMFFSYFLIKQALGNADKSTVIYL